MTRESRWVFGLLIFAAALSTIVGFAPSPVDDLRKENRLLRGDIQTAIHVVGFMRDDIAELRARLADLEATRPNTQTEQERP